MNRRHPTIMLAPLVPLQLRVSVIRSRVWPQIIHTTQQIPSGIPPALTRLMTMRGSLPNFKPKKMHVQAVPAVAATETQVHLVPLAITIMDPRGRSPPVQGMPLAHHRKDRPQNRSAARVASSAS